MFQESSRIIPLINIQRRGPCTSWGASAVWDLGQGGHLCACAQEGFKGSLWGARPPHFRAAPARAGVPSCCRARGTFDACFPGFPVISLASRSLVGLANRRHASADISSAHRQTFWEQGVAGRGQAGCQFRALVWKNGLCRLRQPVSACLSSQRDWCLQRDEATAPTGRGHILTVSSQEGWHVHRNLSWGPRSCVLFLNSTKNTVWITCLQRVPWCGALCGPW